MPPDGYASCCTYAYVSATSWPGRIYSNTSWCQSERTDKTEPKPFVVKIPLIVEDIILLDAIQRCRKQGRNWEHLERKRTRLFAAFYARQGRKPVMHSNTHRFIVPRQHIRQPCWRSTRFKSLT